MGERSWKRRKLISNCHLISYVLLGTNSVSAFTLLFIILIPQTLLAP